MGNPPWNWGPGIPGRGFGFFLVLGYRDACRKQISRVKPANPWGTREILKNWCSNVPVFFKLVLKRSSFKEIVTAVWRILDKKKGPWKGPFASVDVCVIRAKQVFNTHQPYKEPDLAWSAFSRNRIPDSAS